MNYFRNAKIRLKVLHMTSLVLSGLTVVLYASDNMSPNDTVVFLLFVLVVQGIARD